MTWREITAADLAECFAMQPACIGDTIVGRQAAVRVWHDLLHSPAFLGVVVEADRAVAGHRIVACGMGVFVSREFADQEIAKPMPGLNSRIIGGVASGRGVVLNYKELSLANAGGGLDFVNMYGAWRERHLSPHEIVQVHAVMAASFVEDHAGYRLNRVLKEAVGAPQMGLAKASGIWRVIMNFHESDSALLMVHPRESAVEVPYSTMAALYHYREPRLGLRDGHQRLLLAALKGATDSELAVRLHLSVPAIKKRWLSIFERIEAVKPELLEDSTECEITDHKRGPQKRHRVISYVRDHPEELRPYWRPRGKV